MKISYIKNLHEFNSFDNVVALGYFDGFHLGHLKVLNEALSISSKTSKKSMILTTNQSVKSYLNNEKERILLSNEDKIFLASSLGFDSIVFLEVCDEFVNTSMDDFYNLLLKEQACLVFGVDYTFGKNGLGNSKYLIERNEDKVKIIPIFKANDKKIGSREIKDLITSGDIENIDKYLGRPYSFRTHAYKRNNTFAFNFSSYVIPHNGIYEMELKAKNINLMVQGRIKKIDKENAILIKGIDQTLKAFDLTNGDELVITVIREKHLV